MAGCSVRDSGISILAKRAGIFWLRISMDRISDSDSEDAGSIPAGATVKADIKRQAGSTSIFQEIASGLSALCRFIFLKRTNEICFRETEQSKEIKTA